MGRSGTPSPPHLFFATSPCQPLQPLPNDSMPNPGSQHATVQSCYTVHALLATNKTDDLLCIQEPWFSHIGVACVDDEWDGQDVLEGAAHPNWDLTTFTILGTNGLR